MTMNSELFRDAQNKFSELIQIRLTNLDTWTRGHFAEALVAASLPGANFSQHGAAPCDLDWDGITIAVRATGSRSTDHVGDESRKPFAGNWKFPATAAWNSETHDWDEGDPQRCRADVAILAFHDGFKIETGWSFFVLSGEQIERYPSISITPKNLGTSGFVSVLPEGLANEVKRVASE